MKIDRSVIRQCAGALFPCVLSMLTGLPSWAGEAQQCQTYASLALNQRAIATPLVDPDPHGRAGTGDGCPGADGDRWTYKEADHFSWCMDVDPEFAAFETNERRKFLLNCTRENEKKSVPERDVTSCNNFDPYMACEQSPDAQGLQSCKADGDNILKCVNKIRADRTLLHDDTRDKGLVCSRYYHHFSHWWSYECVERTRSNGIRRWALEGITVAPLGGFQIPADPLESSGVVKKPPAGSIFKQMKP